MSLNKNTFLLFLLLGSVVFSQENSKKKDSITNLDEVLVTATRTERQLSSLPLPAQIITKEQIKASNSIRLSDLINEQTGLITIKDHGQEGVQIQGMDSQYTLVMIDGVPLIGRLTGDFDLSRITVANVKQVEIVKGASSCLYGSEAMGGVINVITETPTDTLTGNFYHRSGTFNTHDTSVNLNLKKKKLSFSGLVNRYSTQGYDLDNFSEGRTLNPFNNLTAQVKLGYELNKKTSLTFLARLFHQKRKEESVNTVLPIYYRERLDEYNSQFKIDHKFNSKWDASFELYATQYKTKSYSRFTDNSIEDGNVFNQLFFRPEVRAHYKPNKAHSVIFGGGLTHERIDRTLFDIKPKFNAPYVFAQYDVNPTEKLNIIAGARYDAHNEYKSQFSPKLAARYKITNKLAVKASAGYGYKAPDFRQLYLNFTNPAVGYTVLGYFETAGGLQQLYNDGAFLNQQTGSQLVSLQELNEIIDRDFSDELRPESSVNLNFGIDYKFNNQLKASVNLFRNNIRNLIEAYPIVGRANGQNVFGYRNFSKVYTQGLEFNTIYAPIKQLQISGGYQLLYAKSVEAEEKFENGEVTVSNLVPGSPVTYTLRKKDYFGLANRSRHMANIKVFYKNSAYNFDANIRGTYRSEYGLFDTNQNQYLDKFDEFVEGYSIWDLAINKTFYKKYQLGFGVDNVFEFTDPRQSDTDVISINNIPGRIFYGKLNVNF
ncbi:TonB-dependent receptor plug domain-containing protein [Pseudofulvibacter geojedonensis]|uniref:TonB-dependent receptor plug domain-containing protein n=1 Tax=Pseudofulvibacter geojedonensis TaxID=1123758 RepID=A0ABW3I271_9FLAO